MTNTWFLYYVFVKLPLNLKAMHAKAGVCGGINGTNTCCAGFQWDIGEQICIPCKTGYTGVNCGNKCVYPLFGKDCQSACNCKKIDCDHVEGCKRSTGKTVSNICDSANGTSCCFGYQWDREKNICIPCEAGYTGFNCTIKCLYPSYGQGCQSTCKCTKEVCDHMYGCKTPTGNICIGINGTECCHGYQLNKEETKCIPCEMGYIGHNCKVICPFPSYGLDCQSICNCTETDCNPVDGCSGHVTEIETHMQNDSTKAVDREVYKKVPNDKKQSMLMIGISVLAAAALFIVFAIFYTYRLENTNKENESNIYCSIK